MDLASAGLLVVKFIITLRRSTPAVIEYRRFELRPPGDKCFCSKETLDEHLAQDIVRVFLWIKNTQNHRVRFPVGTQKFGECTLSTSQAGLRRRARVSRRTDQPSYRDKGPTGL